MSERMTSKLGPVAQTRTRRFRIGAVLLLAVVAGLILWLVLRDSAGSSSSASGDATAASVDEIRSLSETVGHPVFWVGPKRGYTYELTRASSGAIYIRYLPPGEEVGVEKGYLTIVTYPFQGAYEAIQEVGKERGVTPIPLAGDGLAAASRKDRQRVHAAYPGVDYQIELYDPTPGNARALVRASLRPVDKLRGGFGTAAPKPTAVTPAALRSLANELGHPLYWVGRRKGFTYELVRSPRGQVYIRYLPPGTDLGSPEQHLTVGTYPFQGAFGAILALGREQNAETIRLERGGRAVVDTSNPTSIHLAYPGSDFEVEVYAPSPARARQLVESGQVRTIG